MWSIHCPPKQSETKEPICENNCKEAKQFNPRLALISLHANYLTVLLLGTNCLFTITIMFLSIKKKLRMGQICSRPQSQWEKGKMDNRKQLGAAMKNGRDGGEASEWADVTWVRESGPVHYVDLLLLSSLVRRLVWPIGRLQGNVLYRDQKP